MKLCGINWNCKISVEINNYYMIENSLFFCFLSNQIIRALAVKKILTK